MLSCYIDRSIRMSVIMLRAFAVGFVMALASDAAYAQASTPAGLSSVRFEAASLKIAPPRNRPFQQSDPGRMSFQNSTLQGLLWEAYRVWPYQIVWPREWKREQYDLTATFAPGSSKAQVREMLQELLAERLNLRMHHESRELPVYALTIAKSGLRMHKVELDPDGDPQTFPSNIQFLSQDKVIKGKLPMTYLVLVLGMDLDRPLVDMTGLKDVYEIDLQYTAAPRPNQAAYAAMSQEELGALKVSAAASLMAALESKLGLHVEARKAPVDMIVIDHVETTPIEN